MLKTIKTILLALLFLQYGYSQTINDALRYSLIDVGGTARTVGVGGGIGALGADFSVLSTNPAGLAVYRSSELTFTPTFFSNQADATLTNGTGNGTESDSRSNFNFNNVGIVLANQPYASKWKTSNVAIGINRINNYHNRFFFEGNSLGSYTDRFFELAYDESGAPLTFGQLDPFEAGLAAEAGALIDLTGEPDPRWETDFFDNPIVFKDQLVRSSGSINELLFGWGANYDEKLMIGVSVGVPIVSFSEVKEYREIDQGTARDGDIPIFNDLRFEESLLTSGVGVNAKLGLIYRFSQAVRLGLSVHTPTFYGLTDDYSTILEYSFNDESGLEARLSANSPDGNFDYRLSTPWRVLGSFGYIIGKTGFLSAEVEYVDYGSASFNLTRTVDDIITRQFENELNDEVSSLLASAINIRLGGEYALNSFRFRAGFGINGDAYDNTLGLTSTALSAGLGWRAKGFYTDFAYKLRLVNESYSPYRLFDPSQQQIVDIERQIHRIMLTLGFRF